MRSDNLKFLYQADNEDLRTLCDIITTDTDGKNRFTENLTSSESYKRNYPNNMKALIPDMIEEFEKFGGNTFLNLIRRGGIPHREILKDVAHSKKVKYKEQDSDEYIEQELLVRIFNESVKKMDKEQLEALRESMNISQGFSKEAIIAAIQAAIRLNGFQSYVWAVSVANALSRTLLGRGLTLAANAAFTRYLAVFAGPIGWVLTGLLTAIDIAGPAYRVTVPAVIQIAYIRKKCQYVNREQDEEPYEFNPNPLG